ncbi:RNA polymerase sigma factor [Marinoscillum furvescens]|uniref:RNA polymerase sigma-70 factor (ECF subfamily) n=1 Tax=Marinoscillum furvescens DSM 4134 TaxID=1122208 RepID=A0A3D9L3A4_MARFU|nr:RNA polymerase sigma-70 factor [Marinoscillum furvescens]RED97440.1 RNA polymerase sigma-70 factor (ECF subfamily) [Marinoscillum furvescens DSM 4134]
MTKQDDATLFDQIKNDDYQSFEVVFRSYYAELTRFATSIVRNQTIGEEIAQEAFIYIWEKRHKIALKGSLKAYLMSSVKNKCINYIRLELPKQQATTDLEGVSAMTTEMPEDESGALKRKIQLAIDQLPKKCKSIFVLSRYGGLTYAEIAEELEISTKTVENQMTIALRKLKESLNEELKNHGL